MKAKASPWLYELQLGSLSYMKTIIKQIHNDLYLLLIFVTHSFLNQSRNSHNHVGFTPPSHIHIIFTLVLIDADFGALKILYIVCFHKNIVTILNELNAIPPISISHEREPNFI